MLLLSISLQLALSTLVLAQNRPGSNSSTSDRVKTNRAKLGIQQPVRDNIFSYNNDYIAQLEDGTFVSLSADKTVSIFDGTISGGRVQWRVVATKKDDNPYIFKGVTPTQQEQIIQGIESIQNFKSSMASDLLPTMNKLGATYNNSDKTWNVPLSNGTNIKLQTSNNGGISEATIIEGNPSTAFPSLNIDQRNALQELISKNKLSIKGSLISSNDEIASSTFNVTDLSGSKFRSQKSLISYYVLSSGKIVTSSGTIYTNGKSFGKNSLKEHLTDTDARDLISMLGGRNSIEIALHDYRATTSSSREEKEITDSIVRSSMSYYGSRMCVLSDKHPYMQWRNTQEARLRELRAGRNNFASSVEFESDKDLIISYFNIDYSKWGP